MASNSATIERGTMDSERAKHLLDRFKPRTSQTYDERIQPEDVDKIAAAIEADPNLSPEERGALLSELTDRYDRIAKLSPYNHMGS